MASERLMKIVAIIVVFAFALVLIAGTDRVNAAIRHGIWPAIATPTTHVAVPPLPPRP